MSTLPVFVLLGVVVAWDPEGRQVLGHGELGQLLPDDEVLETLLCGEFVAESQAVVVETEPDARFPSGLLVVADRPAIRCSGCGSAPLHPIRDARSVRTRCAARRSVGIRHGARRRGGIGFADTAQGVDLDLRDVEIAADFEPQPALPDNGPLPKREGVGRSFAVGEEELHAQVAVRRFEGFRQCSTEQRGNSRYA